MTSAPPKEIDSLGFLLSDIARLSRRVFEQRLQGHALTLTQAKVLLHVNRHAGIRQVDLADLLDVQPITLARLIDQLSQASMVERRPDPQDRRAYQLHLLPAAMPVLKTITRVIEDSRAAALKGVSAPHAAITVEVLRTIHTNLSAQR